MGYMCMFTCVTGQVCVACDRCMGTYDRGLGVFRCVSVRLATDSEKMFRHNMVQACDRAMRLWITSELRR